MFPNMFPFEPLDYNTTKGIDIIARNKTDNIVSESEFWYIELKLILKKEFNHAFRHLRWILCWDFDKNINDTTDFMGVEESDIRKLKIEKDTDEDGKEISFYFLENRMKANRIEIFKFKDFLKNKLNIEFVL